MSEIRATTISDAAGTGPITLTGQEGVKARGQCDPAANSHKAGTFNVSSITDGGVDGKTFSFTNAFTTEALYAIGRDHIGDVSQANGFAFTAASSSSSVRVKYYNGSSYLDTNASFSAMGDLA